MSDLRRVKTERLELRAIVSPDDLEGLFRLMNAPAQWGHAPASRHVDRAITSAWIERAASRWKADGLSYWAVRLRATDAIIGVGGAQRQVTRAWNLLWRIDAAHQGQGLATELGTAAIAAAHATDDSVPVIAWILSHNVASLGVARRLGLMDNGARVDPSDGRVRLAFADRPLPAPPMRE